MREQRMMQGKKRNKYRGWVTNLASSFIKKTQPITQSIQKPCELLGLRTVHLKEDVWQVKNSHSLSVSWYSHYAKQYAGPSEHQEQDHHAHV